MPSLVAFIAWISLLPMPALAVDAHDGTNTAPATGAGSPDAALGGLLGAPLVDPALALGDARATPVILVFDASQDVAVSARLDSLGVAFHLYPRLHMADALLARIDLGAILAIPGLRQVDAVETMTDELAHSVPYIGADRAWGSCACRGEGVSILIVDSGIDGTHPDVRYHDALLENTVPVHDGAGLVVGHREGVESSDENGHGTHVASIAAGRGDFSASTGTAGLRGVAPRASLVGFRAGEVDGKGDVRFDTMTVLEAFEYALDTKDEYHIGVVSNSWGANGEFDPHNPVNEATLELYKAGLLVVFAAGNEGEQGGHTLNKYSVAPWVLSVTAGDYHDHIADFASRGRDDPNGPPSLDHPDLVAPGVEITAAKAHLAGDPSPVHGGFVTLSGSSMAAPHVAGAAALLLSKYPALSPDDLMDALVDGARPLHVPLSESGAGYLDVPGALRVAAQTTGGREAFLAGHRKYAGDDAHDATNARRLMAGTDDASPLAVVGRAFGPGVYGIRSEAFLVGLVVCALGAYGVRRGPSSKPSGPMPSVAGRPPAPFLLYAKKRLRAISPSPNPTDARPLIYPERRPSLHANAHGHAAVRRPQ